MQHVLLPILRSSVKPIFSFCPSSLRGLSVINGATSNQPFSIAAAGWTCRPSPSWHNERRCSKTIIACPSSHQFHTTTKLPARRPRANQSIPLRPSFDSSSKVRIPFGNISRAQLAVIFGQEMKYEEGNDTLRALHGRRVTGALVDRGVHIDDTAIPREALIKALEWLRENYPVDEQAAAQGWADMEAKKVQDEYVARAERLGIYQPVEKEVAGGRVEDLSTSYTGRSVLEEFKQYHEQRRDREAKEKEKSGETQREQEVALTTKEQRAERQLVFEEKIAKRREERAKQGMVTPEDTEMPDLTTFERLFRPTLFGISIIIACYVATQYYAPPPIEGRLLPQYPASVATVGALAGLNILVFLMWRVPPMWKMLNKYTTLTPALPCSLSILGNIVSHSQFLHLMGNVFGLLLFAIPVHEDIGRANVLALFTAGGVVGAISSLWFHVLTKNFIFYTQGASGGVYALGVAWAYFAYRKPKIPGKGDDVAPFLFDVSRWALLIFSILPHFLPAFWLRTDGMAHIGGALTGLATGMWISLSAFP